MSKEAHCKYPKCSYPCPDLPDCRDAEQPAQQEPVAVVSGYYGGQCVILPIDPARIFNSNTALYTTPQPPAQPLTDEQIDKLPWGPHEGNPMTFAEGLRDFARAIEAAHGIKENT